MRLRRCSGQLHDRLITVQGCSPQSEPAPRTSIGPAQLARIASEPGPSSSRSAHRASPRPDRPVSPKTGVWEVRGRWFSCCRRRRGGTGLFSGDKAIQKARSVRLEERRRAPVKEVPSTSIAESNSESPGRNPGGVPGRLYSGQPLPGRIVISPTHTRKSTCRGNSFMRWRTCLCPRWRSFRDQGQLRCRTEREISINHLWITVTAWKH